MNLHRRQGQFLGNLRVLDLGGLLQGCLASHAGKLRQIEEDDRIRVSHLATVTGEGRRETDMIEPGHHENAFLGENSGFRTLGQNDTPALESGTNTAPVNHRRHAGRIAQESGKSVVDLRLIEPEHQRKLISKLPSRSVCVTT